MSCGVSVFVGVFFANSSGELYTPQLGGHVTPGSLTVEHVDEICDFTGCSYGSVIGA